MLMSMLPILWSVPKSFDCLAILEMNFLWWAQEKDGALQRARTAARAAEEKREREATAASRQPLDASQRAVIRDLSLKVAHLSRSLQKAKSERDQLQVGAAAGELPAHAVWFLRQRLVQKPSTQPAEI